MASTKQREAAIRNLEKARSAQSGRAHGKSVPHRSPGMTAAQENSVSDSEFAFPEERKEPLTDAAHVRNAVARFGQVEEVSDDERDKAWSRIKTAAKKYDVELSADNWRELSHGGKGP
jgi:hypothetical protein